MFLFQSLKNLKNSKTATLIWDSFIYCFKNSHVLGHPKDNDGGLLFPESDNSEVPSLQIRAYVIWEG